MPREVERTPGHRSRVDRAAALAGHVVVAVAVTAPLAWRLDRLPLGREPVATVPQFNLWTLEWTASRLPHGLSGWWDAPIFWPTKGAFAFSEPQPLTGLAFAALRPIAGGVAAYGLLVLLTVVLNGVTAAALARRLGAGRLAAFVAGVLAQTLPFVFDQLGVLQLVSVWPLFAALACAVAWLDEPDLRWGALVGLSLAAAAGTCGYYTALFGLCLALSLPWAVTRAWRDDIGRRLRSGGVAAGVFALVAGPFLLAQRNRLDGYRWSEATIRAGSAPWHEWAPGGALWPGAALLALAVLGAAASWRKPATRLLTALAATGLVVSIGTRLSVLGLEPWTVLIRTVDAFAGLRSPFRSAAITQVALVGLAAPGLQWLMARVARGVAVAGSAGLVVALVLLAPGPGRLIAPPPAPGAWATWLADHPDGGAVAFLPFAPGPRAADFEHTTARMLQALGTAHPMLNGYSGFFPPHHGDLREELIGFPDQRSLAAFRAQGVRYVVIDADTYDAFDERIADQLGYTEIRRDGDAVLLRLPPH